MYACIAYVTFVRSLSHRTHIWSLLLELVHVYMIINCMCGIHGHWTGFEPMAHEECSYVTRLVFVTKSLLCAKMCCVHRKSIQTTQRLDSLVFFFLVSFDRRYIFWLFLFFLCFIHWFIVVVSYPNQISNVVLYKVFFGTFLPRLRVFSTAIAGDFPAIFVVFVLFLVHFTPILLSSCSFPFNFIKILESFVDYIFITPQGSYQVRVQWILLRRKPHISNNCFVSFSN